MWEDCGVVSDCEELVGHLMEHLGRNEPNYFMYDSWGLCPSLPLTHQVQAAPASQLSRCTAPHQLPD